MPAEGNNQHTIHKTCLPQGSDFTSVQNSSLLTPAVLLLKCSRRSFKGSDPAGAASVLRAFAVNRKAKHLSLKGWISSQVDSESLHVNGFTIPHEMLLGQIFKLCQF